MIGADVAVTEVLVEGKTTLLQLPEAHPHRIIRVEPLSKVSIKVDIFPPSSEIILVPA